MRAVDNPSADRLHRACWFVTLILTIGFLLPFVAAKGMFLDGVTYATISRNLAEGWGTWWKPYYTATLHPEFYEHPPLGFIIQSAFFWVLGDDYLTEKIYGFASMFVSLGLLVLLWRQILGRRNDLLKFSWVPVLCWITLPRWQWTYKNNLLENTLTVFCLLGSFYAMRALATSEFRAKLWNSFLVGIAITAGFLTKGPVGLFPIALPFLYSTVTNGEAGLRPGLTVSLLSALWVCTLLGLVLLYEPARTNITHYLGSQVLTSLTGDRTAGTMDASRFAFLGSVSRELFLHIIIVLPVLLYGAMRHQVHWSPETFKRAGACLLIALSATLPILVSFKQRSFYIVPALPYFALFLSLLIAPTLSLLFKNWAIQLESFIGKRFYAVGAAILFAILIISYGLLDWPYRDQHVFRDIEAIKTAVPQGEIIGVDTQRKGDWRLHAHLYRFLRISLDGTETATGHRFYLHSQKTLKPPQGFRATSIELHDTTLLKKR